MKRIIFILMAMLCTYAGISQTDTLRQQLDQLFGALDKTQVPSGYLAPYGMQLADKADFNGALTDSNLTNSLDLVRMVYADIQSSRFNPASRYLKSVDSLNLSIAAAGSNSLLIFFGQYSVFKEDAVQQNLLRYTSGRLYDVAGRTQSPYILKNVFAAYPKKNYFNNGVVTLQYNTSLYYSNTTATITQLQVNFGSGYQTVAAGASISNTYTDSSGWHIVILKATLSTGQVLYHKMGVWVDVATVSTARYTNANLTTPDIDIPAVNGVHSGCRVFIRRSIHTPAGKILKPLIVAEGFDLNDGAPDIVKTNYNVNLLLNEWSKVLFAGNDFEYYLDDMAGYDLVFIDWKNSVDDITHNAVLLEDVINRINTLKANSGSAQQNVVMGISMGGLITRYCLASMTKRGLNPQTRLLITHDSPHRGAYVPLAFQHLVFDVQNKKVLGIRLGGVFKHKIHF